ncbi:HEPN domain-containing protein [Agarivorans sp. QJM3NY_25]|uniref:HEPN domain-containing protein n=1 Tax=Agarivorans sp. QJM3NY_25 TaxID=3421430 RepID=UPI003D7C37AF
MSRHSRHNSHDKYRSRIDSLLKSYVAEDSSPEAQAHNAKYLAVLVSGYLEQAVKELLLQYAAQGSRRQISRYVEETWPISKNMNTENIKTILGQFNSNWSDNFLEWLKDKDDRKNDINSVVSWRNSIAHGQESKTNGVTLVSVRRAFSTISELVSFIDTLIKS